MFGKVITRKWRYMGYVPDSGITMHVMYPFVYPWIPWVSMQWLTEIKVFHLTWGNTSDFGLELLLVFDYQILK